MQQFNPNASFKVPAGADSFSPYAHQTKAWDALTRHFLRSKQTAGMVVVPTGGGKTSLALRWLLKEVISQGGRVLWLAHRDSLLRQAFDTCAHSAGAVRGRPSISQILISSRYCSWSEVHKQDVVFSTIQTAALDSNRDFVDLMLDAHPGQLFVVVDEAHHGAAPSYRRLLTHAKKHQANILGLSATPVRARESDGKHLAKLFESIVYQVTKPELIRCGVLSEPYLSRVDTKVEFERDFNTDDYAHLARFGELSAHVLERISQHSTRNGLIAQHYLENRERYGKTLVFAVDTIHVELLQREFLRCGIRSDTVSYRRDDSDKVIARFRRGDAIEVLINVELLTEGVDLPMVQTVLLARPTRSEALLSQMVGRALRGPAAGGTPHAYLVTFVDTWSMYNVLDPTFILASDNVDEDDLPIDPETSPEHPRRPVLLVALELIHEAYKLVHTLAHTSIEGVFDCLPHSWFTWDAEFEDDIQQRHILVFENQREGFDALRSYFHDRTRIPESVSEARAEQLIDSFFGDAPDPLPRAGDVMDFLSALRSGAVIDHYTFEEKRSFDPHRLAPRFRKLTPLEQEAEIEKLFRENELCARLYDGRVSNMLEEISRAIIRLTRREEAPSLPEVAALVTDDLQAWPSGHGGYSLTNLWELVAAVPHHFPDGVPHISDIRFTHTSVRRYFGMYHLGNETIVINQLLNTPSVPQFVLEFLLYHEGLHADTPSAGHNKEFCDRERRFQPSEQARQQAVKDGYPASSHPHRWRALADQFLDTFDRRFTIDWPAASRY